AKWTNQETDALVDFLAEYHSECGDGANFKDVTFNAAALHIKALLVSDKPKDMKSIRYKWRQVSWSDH
ncbi:hypothetical protein J3R82DRAFT_7798, partial [Butyriboletus roseoflavus]